MSNVTGRRQPSAVRRMLSTATAAALLTFIAGCSTSDPREAEDSALPETFQPRDPAAPILGAVSPDGYCDRSVIDINRSKNVADVLYHGQPGDQVTLTFNLKDATTHVEEFGLGNSNTKWQVPTTIYNGDIEDITVEAAGREGIAGKCTINVP